MLVQRQRWDRGTRTFVPAGEPVEVDEAKPTKTSMAVQTPPNRFLKGPIPWDWVIRAAKLPGKALEVGLCLWRLKGLHPTRDTVLLSNAELKPFGIGRAAKSRALHALENAGLITVTHHQGRFPSVTVLTSRA